MAITLVTGGAVASQAGNGGDVTLTFPVGIAQNDVVIVFGGHSNRAANTPGPETGGYASLAQYTTASPFFDVSWKRMGAVPDANVVCHGTGNTADAAAYGCFVLRGVVTSGSPLDQAVATVGPTTSTNPNPPSIVTQTAGAWVLALAGSAVNDASPGTITGYSNHIQGAGNDTGEDYSCAGATREIASPGTEDPGAWSSWASGAWYAASVAIKPALDARTAAAAITEADDTASAAGALAIAGAASVTQADGTISAAAAVSVAATASLTEADDTLAATIGAPSTAADAALTEADDSITAAAAAAIAGAASLAEADDTIAAAGTLPIAAVASATEADDTIATAGTLAIAGAASIAEAGDTLSAAGAVAIAGAAGVTEADDTLAASASTGAGITADADISEADDTLAATASTQTQPEPQPAATASAPLFGYSRRGKRRARKFVERDVFYGAHGELKPLRARALTEREHFGLACCAVGPVRVAARGLEVADELCAARAVRHLRERDLVRVMIELMD
jgi:hypothetical protein